MTSSQIIVFKGKYGDQYYDASTPEAIARAMLSVLRENAQGDWYFPPTEPSKNTGVSSEDAALMELTDEQLSLLPESIRTKVARLRRVNATYEYQYKQDLFWWEQLQRVLNAPRDEALAMTTTIDHGRGRTREISTVKFLCEERRDHEYEGYSIVPLLSGEE